MAPDPEGNLSGNKRAAPRAHSARLATQATLAGMCLRAAKHSTCKERYKEGLLWAGRGTIPVNELA